MRIKFNSSNVIGFILIVLAASLLLGFLRISNLYVLLAIEIAAFSLFVVSKLVRKIPVLKFLWIISTLYILIRTRTFNFFTLYYLLNSLLGLMVIVCIDKESALLAYSKTKLFAVLGLVSAGSIFIELINPSIITNLFRRLAPGELSSIQVYIKQGRYLGITNYVWYTTLFLFLGGGYILSESKNIDSKKRIGGFIALAILIIASFISGSRSTVLVFPLVAVIFYGGKSSIKNTLIAIAAILILYYFVRYSNLQIRVITRLQILVERVAAGDVIDSSRALLREIALSMFRKKPLFGYGWYEFRYHSYTQLQAYYHTHNLYMQLLAENGIIGTFIITLPWIVTYVQTIRYVYMYRNYSDNDFYKIAKYCLLFLTLIYIDSFVHVTIYDPRTMLIFYIISAITNQCIKNVPESYTVAKRNMLEESIT